MEQNIEERLRGFTGKQREEAIVQHLRYVAEGLTSPARKLSAKDVEDVIRAYEQSKGKFVRGLLAPAYRQITEKQDALFIMQPQRGKNIADIYLPILPDKPHSAAASMVEAVTKATLEYTVDQLACEVTKFRVRGSGGLTSYQKIFDELSKSYKVLDLR